MHIAAKRKEATPGELKKVIPILGGRLAYLNKVSRANNMAGMANHMKDVEKAWLLSQIGLIPDCDDDVMDEVRCFSFADDKFFVKADTLDWF